MSRGDCYGGSNRLRLRRWSSRKAEVSLVDALVGLRGEEGGGGGKDIDEGTTYDLPPDHWTAHNSWGFWNSDTGYGCGRGKDGKSPSQVI